MRFRLLPFTAFLPETDGERSFVMKKIYVNPEWELLKLTTEDILTASGDVGGSGGDPYGEDKNWNLNL